MGAFLESLKRLFRGGRPEPVIRTVAGHSTTNGPAPRVEIVTNSYADNPSIIDRFCHLLETQGTRANAVETFQGEDARRRRENDWTSSRRSTAAQPYRTLKQSHRFAKHVNRALREMTDKVEDDLDWFFVFHPDTMWHSSFISRIRRSPLSKAFCGYSSCLDAAVVFLCAVREWETKRRRSLRRRREKKGEKAEERRPRNLHLIIPADQQLLVYDHVCFPPRLAPFSVEGVTQGSIELVALNLPAEQSDFLVHIHNWQRPAVGFLQSVASFFTGQELPSENGTPRELGMPGRDEDSDASPSGHD